MGPFTIKIKGIQSKLIVELEWAASYNVGEKEVTPPTRMTKYGISR